MLPEDKKCKLIKTNLPSILLILMIPFSNKSEEK